MLISAYWYEGRCMISAESAHSIPGGHFYCPVTTCLVEVVPARRKNYFFRSKNDGHKPICPHYNEPKFNSGVYVQGNFPTENLPRHIPTNLGPPLKQFSDWNNPTEAELRSLIQEVDETVIHYGTFDEVINAWREMSPPVRHSTSLTVRGTKLTYFSAFDLQYEALRDVSSIEWDRRIVTGQAKVFRPTGHVCWIFSTIKFSTPSGAGPLAFTLSPAQANALLGDFPEKPLRLDFFWLGRMPDWDSEKSRLVIKHPESETFHGFRLALRDA
jgi:hypothetical protein